jgi:Uma2 family endonuclease
MAIGAAEHLEAVRHLPAGATLIFPAFPWDEYERLLEDLADGPRVRVSFDRGRLEVMSPLPEHEEYARFIDELVRAWADALQVNLEKRGSATWKKRSLAKGVEPDASYFVQNADRIIGKRRLDLESDPPPDIVVEVDVTNESIGRFPIYSALSVPEIWRYDGRAVIFYTLISGSYHEIPESRCLPGLTPGALTEALEQSKTAGQTAALATFREGVERRAR